MKRTTLVGVTVLVATTVALAALVRLDALALTSAIRAGYAPLAALVALLVYVLTPREPAAGTALLSAGQTAKLVVLLGGLCIAATAWTGDRLLPLVCVLPVAYLLIADQIRYGGDPVPTVFATVVVFVVPAVTKYLTTDVYFGGSDTFAHVDAVYRLLDAGYTTVLPHGYDFFPSFHLYVGSGVLLGGLTPYDALVLLGIGVAATLVPTMYLVAAHLFEDERLPLAVALAVTAVEWVGYHALYFFPQMLAVVLVAVGFSVVVSLPTAGTTRRYRRYGAYALGLVALLVFVHHLTYVVLVAPLAVAAVIALVVPRLATRLDGPSATALSEVRSLLRFRWNFPAVVGLVAVTSYLTYSGSAIAAGIFDLGFDIAREVATSATTSTFSYGVTPRVDTLSRAVEWLWTPTGLYSVLFGTVALVGLYDILGRWRRYAGHVALLTVGVGSIPVFLPLPIAVPQLARISVVLTLVAVFPLGVGLARLLHASRTPSGRAVGVAALVLLSTFGTAGALTTLTADDVRALDTVDRTIERDMSDREFAAVVQTTRFLSQYGTEPASTDRITDRAFDASPVVDSHRLTRRGRGLETRADGLAAPPGTVVVRDSWPDHVVLVATDAGLLSDDLTFFTVSRQRYRTGVGTHSVVYAAGESRVLYSADGYSGLFGDTEPDG